MTESLQTLKSLVKIARAHLLGSVGVARYSSPGLNDLDAKLDEYLPKRGIFLEIGANDGYSQSNTFRLEARGWTGILIEPIPRLYRLCKAHRRSAVVFNYACTAPDGPSEVSLIDSNLTTRISDGAGAPAYSHRIAATTLSSLIDTAGYQHLDFVSIDVEGHEEQVLAGLDMQRHTPSWLLVETKQFERVSRQLAPAMHFEAQLTHHDYLFRRASPRQATAVRD